MSALVRHFGDVKDASLTCGICDVCDPAGAVLRLFRHATTAEREMVQGNVDELRSTDYKATGTLQRSLDPQGRLNRNEFDGLLDAMVRSGLIEIENAEYEKDGEVRRFRKVRLTEAWLQVRAGTPLPLLISDGVVEEFAPHTETKSPVKKSKAVAGKSGKKIGIDSALIILSPEGEALAARLREWRAAEAKRLGVPAYVLLHDKTLTAVAHNRPANPNQLLAINGMGPAKVEKFGETILALCRATG